MAQFYGTLHGNRGEASRLGTKSSGLTVTGLSWDGGAEVRLWHDEGAGVDMLEVSLVPHFSTGRGTRKVLYSGPASGAPVRAALV